MILKLFLKPRSLRNHNESRDQTIRETMTSPRTRKFMKPWRVTKPDSLQNHENHQKVRETRPSHNILQFAKAMVFTKLKEFVKLENFKTPNESWHQIVCETNGVRDTKGVRESRTVCYTKRVAAPSLQNQRSLRCQRSSWKQNTSWHQTGRDTKVVHKTKFFFAIAELPEKFISISKPT